MRTVCVGMVTLLLAVSFVPMSFAESDIGFYGIGGRIGLVMPEDPIESTFGLGIQADLGTLTKDIHLSAILDYWSKSYDAGTAFYGSADWSWTEIVIGATAKYFFEVQSEIEPYAGAGLGLTIGRWKWETSYMGIEYDESASDTDLGFHLVGGVEYPLSPTLKGIAEAKYHLNGVDYFGIFVGVTYMLGK